MYYFLVIICRLLQKCTHASLLVLAVLPALGEKLQNIRNWFWKTVHLIYVAVAYHKTQCTLPWRKTWTSFHNKEKRTEINKRTSRQWSVLKLVLRLFCKTSFPLPPPRGKMLRVTGSNRLQKHSDSYKKIYIPLQTSAHLKELLVCHQ